jgi:hypothetical protein
MPLEAATGTKEGGVVKTREHASCQGALSTNPSVTNQLNQEGEDYGSHSRCGIDG